MNSVPKVVIVSSTPVVSVDEGPFAPKGSIPFSWIPDGFDMEVSDGSGLEKHRPFNLVLVCGLTPPYSQTKGARLIELPALDYHGWTDKARRFVGRLIREGTEDLEIRFDKRTGRLIVETLVPF